MKKQSHWKEIRNTHFVTDADVLPADGNIKMCICIDAWKTDHDWEEGEVIAHVILSKHGDILVSYHDNLARVDEAAQAAIEEAKEMLRKHWHQERNPADYPTLTLEQLLKSTFCAEVVFLKELKPVPAEIIGEGKDNYQFMRKQTCYGPYWRLANTLERLAKTGVMDKADALEYIRKTQEMLVKEFAAITPPPEGKRYEFAGVGPENILMLRICDNQEV